MEKSVLLDQIKHLEVLVNATAYHDTFDTVILSFVGSIIALTFAIVVITIAIWLRLGYIKKIILYPSTSPIRPPRLARRPTLHSSRPFSWEEEYKSTTREEIMRNSETSTIVRTFKCEMESLKEHLENEIQAMSKRIETRIDLMPPVAGEQFVKTMAHFTGIEFETADGPLVKSDDAEEKKEQ